MKHRCTGAVPALTMLLGLALVTGCMKKPDLNARPEGATPLELGVWHEDSLDCADSGDCRDWFRVVVPGEGRVVVEAVRVEEAEAGPPFRVEIANPSGAELARLESKDRDRVRLAARTIPGQVLVAMALPDPRSGALRYQLKITFEP